VKIGYPERSCYKCLSNNSGVVWAYSLTFEW